jgi:hypothetical protein
MQIESDRIDEGLIKSCKDYFLAKSQMEKEADENITFIREFLCEAFCLVDIKSELHSLQVNQNSFDNVSMPRQSLDPATFGSPGNFISPIAGQQSMNQSIDISHNILSPQEDTQKKGVTTKYTYTRHVQPVATKKITTRTSYEI